MITSSRKEYALRTLFLMFCLFAVVSLFIAPQSAEAAVKYSLSNGSKITVKLDKEKGQLLTNKTLTLNASINKPQNYVSSVKWTSKDSSIASVNSEGKVTARKCGTTTITCTVKDRSGISSSASCKVTVYDGSISLSKTSLSLNAASGNSVTLKCTLKYINTTTTNLTWSSSNTKVATVNSSGKVIAKAAGTAKITAKNKQTGHTAVCTVSVFQEKKLSVAAREQSNSSTCSGAAAKAVLRYVGSSYSGSDLDLYRAMKKKHPNSSNTVGDIVGQLNTHISGKPYTYKVCTSKTKWLDTVMKSIDKGYPVIALVKFGKNSYFDYSTSGHFTVIRGYLKKADGTVTLYIADSYKTSKNGGTFSIPLDKMFSYSKNKGGYLIVAK